jgi:hypothetical protein
MDYEINNPNAGRLGQSTVRPYAAPVEDRILLLDSAIADTQRATHRVAALADQIRQRADSIFGPRPPAPTLANNAGNMGKIAGAPFRASGLRTATSDLHEALHVLESEAERFADL